MPTRLAIDLVVNPDDPNAHALNVEHELGHTTVREALEQVGELERRFPNNPRLLALHADILKNVIIRQRKPGAKGWKTYVEQARGLYRRSIAASAFNPPAYTGLGELYAAVPDLEPIDEGIAAIDTAVIYEARPQLFRALADRYLRKKQLRAALLSMRNAVAFNTEKQRPFDVLLLKNLELLTDLTQATPTETGLSFKSGATNTGPVRDGKPDGMGTWLRLDGSSYEGEFKDGVPSGHGTLKSERGDVYDGDFSNGFASGKGNMTFAPDQMTSYDGDVVNATPDGTGVLVTRSGRLAATFRHGVAVAGGSFTPAPRTARSRGNRLAPFVKSGHTGGMVPADPCKDHTLLKPEWRRFRNATPISPGNTGNN